MPPLTLPGPQIVPSQTSISFAKPPERPRPFWDWFPSFLKQELAPYPGRSRIVMRMVCAATIAMLLIMTFHLVGAGIAGVYTLFVSRETPQATYRATLTMIGSYLAGLIYLVLGSLLFVNYPLTHFLWVVVSLFFSFYALRVYGNSVAAAAFGIMVTLAIPIWDVTAPPELLLVEILWTVGGIGIGLGAAALVEYIFSGFGARNDLIAGLQERLETVANVLDEHSRGPISSTAQKKLADIAIVGLSRLRTLASLPHLEHFGPSTDRGAISLVGRLVDLTIALSLQFGEAEAADRIGESIRSKQLADRMRTISAALDQRGDFAKIPPAIDKDQAAWLTELEQTTDLLVLSLSADPEDQQSTVDVMKPHHAPLLTSDSFTNPEHLRYALKGCLAGTLCYIFMNAVAYEGIRTALITCFITSLTSTGVSRQKQLLRFTGAFFGGLVLGVGGQVLVLPMLDGIGGFTIFFVVVTWASAWIATSSSRLSYFGIQMALAFYLINLQEFYPQTDLTLGRDRVLGIGLGLFAMWLVFDIVGSTPAVTAMRNNLRVNLGLVADFVQHRKSNGTIEPQAIRTKRDEISSRFNQLTAQADGVLFETGQRRQHDLAERGKLLGIQARLHSLFLLEIGLMHYRAELAQSGASALVIEAQLSFDVLTAQELRLIVEALDGLPETSSLQRLRIAHRELKQSLQAEPGMPASRIEAISSLTSGVIAGLEAVRHDVIVSA